jgi:hypothetical protein
MVTTELTRLAYPHIVNLDGVTAHDATPGRSITDSARCQPPGVLKKGRGRPRGGATSRVQFCKFE